MVVARPPSFTKATEQFFVTVSRSQAPAAWRRGGYRGGGGGGKMRSSRGWRRGPS